MAHIRLEKVRREWNEARFYEMTITASLFGDWVLERRWGRIGCEGERKTDIHLSEEAVRQAALSVAAEKQAGGYRIVADEIGIPALPGAFGSAAERRLLVADELDRLLDELPSRDSRFGTIVASLATACRRTGRSLKAARATPGARGAWALDDTEYRIRARIFQLLDELVTGAIGPDEAERISFRLIQDATGALPEGGVVGFVPRTLWSALDLPLEEALGGAPGLNGVRQGLAERGLLSVGQLVQAPYGDVLAAAGGRRDVVARVEERLRRYGLRLGTRVPGWKAPPGGHGQAAG